MKRQRHKSAAIACTAALALTFALCAAVQSHEYWLDPPAPVKVGDSIDLAAWVGEGFVPQERKVLTREKLRSLRWLDSDGETDLLAGVDVKHDLRSTRARAAGTALLALESRRSFIELDAVKFDAYLGDEGLDEILAARVKAADGIFGCELYQRCAKAIVKVTSANGEAVARERDSPATRPAGLRLELTPRQDPTVLAPGGALDVSLQFDGKPLAGCLVQVWHRKRPPAVPVDTAKPVKRMPALDKLRTSPAGVVRVKLERGGEYLVSSVHMVPANSSTDPDHPTANYESFWASLTFRIESPPESRPPSSR